MIEKILERLEAEKETANRTYETFEHKVDLGRTFGLEKAIAIVQEVAKEYGNGWIPVEEGLPKWEIEEDYTEDVHTVLRWWDGDITYGVGWYRKNFGWSEDGANCKVIAWKPIAPYQKSPSRCDTCTHNVADEVPPICYMCSKGIEDNYEPIEQKGE